MAGGRPPKFRDVAELQDAIDRYFTEREQQGKPLTVTGLALALDTTRDVIIDVESGNGPYADNPEFSHAIKKAKLRCQAFAEDQMYCAKNPAGPIFALKNFGWRDKQEVDTTIKGKLQVDSTLSDDDLDARIQALLDAGQDV